jgi:hypothetical protein
MHFFLGSRANVSLAHQWGGRHQPVMYITDECVCFVAALRCRLPVISWSAWAPLLASLHTLASFG